jgi:biopolymer transport protein ExbB
MQMVGEDENMRIEHRLSWLAILGTLGPLLGLLGTVEGIIASFRVIATSDTQPKPSLLAEGISTSLFNTFEGLFVAIIATVAFMLLRNQAARLVLEAEIASENLMFRFKNVAPTKPA